MLHIHVLLVAPLGTGHMDKPGTDWYKNGVAVWETANHTRAAADFSIQTFNDIIGADTGPVFAGKIVAGQSLLNAVLHLPEICKPCLFLSAFQFAKLILPYR